MIIPQGMWDWFEWYFTACAYESATHCEKG